jgi:hypothetical protein
MIANETENQMSHCRWASRMDDFLKLDLASFEREWFARWRIGRVTWSRGGRETGSIGYRLGPDDMELSYRHGRGNDAEDVTERIAFTFTEQPLGGRRRWFVCKSCQRRCRVLIGGARFRCRQCYRATYPSQYETFRAPGLAKAETARERVGAEPGIGNPFPQKPKGMHWRTYKRLEAVNWDAVLAIERVLAGEIRRRNH